VILEARKLTRAYGDIVAVDSMDLELAEGEIVALAGPDGAGKTTLFRALAGLIDFDSGEAKIAGFDVRREFHRIKPLLGYMPQSFSLYADLSVEENLRFYAGLFGLTRQAFAEKRRRLYEFSGLGPFAGRRAGHLSGGMKQKLALSCALVHDPEVLLLDEPTTGVDPLSRRQFWDILSTLRSAGSAIVVSTPYMDEVALADRAVLIHRGKRLAVGTPRELIDQFHGRVYRLRSAASNELIRRIERLDTVGARRLGASIHVFTPADYPVERLRADLSRAGVPDDIELTEPWLEDVFVQMMGD
jgi:ABC-2 type transport system ATP-binding protein